MYWNDKLKLLLSVYVDDYKMSGPKSTLANGWKLLRSGIDTEDPGPLSRYIGCDHEIKELPDGREISYGMEPFFCQCLDKYSEVSGKPIHCTKALTPFLDDKRFTDEQINTIGILGMSACRVLMKILYGARMYRYDLLKATCMLAAMVTKWSVACDMMLYRLCCYIKCSLHYRLVGYICNKMSELNLSTWADADLAGDRISSRSTSGCLHAITASKSYVPLAGQTKKQTCVSFSTLE